MRTSAKNCTRKNKQTNKQKRQTNKIYLKKRTFTEG